MLYFRDLYGAENIGNEILVVNTKYLQLFNFMCVKLKQKQTNKKKTIKFTSSEFEFFDFFEFCAN